MKSCPKCHFDNEDSANYCSKCGIKLNLVNKCFICGHDVKEDDKYCPHCGNKLIKREPLSFKTPFVKYIFSALFIICLICAAISFIGLFGDIFTKNVVNSVTSNPVPGKTTIDVSYFFGQAAKEIGEAFNKYKVRNDYPVILLVFLILEYIFWILAMVGIIYGAIKVSIALYKIIKNDEYKKSYYKDIAILAISGIPYLAIFAIECLGDSSTIINGATQVEVVGHFGYGSKMILVSSIILLVIAFIYFNLFKNIDKYQKDNSLSLKDLTLNILQSALFASFVMTLILCLGITINADKTGQYLNGGMFPYSYQISASGSSIGDAIELLKQYSEQQIDIVPYYVPNLIIGPSLYFAAILFILLAIYFYGEDITEINIFLFVVYFALLLAGYIVTYIGENDLFKEMVVSRYAIDYNDAVKFSYSGIAILTLGVINIAFNFVNTYFLSAKKKQVVKVAN